MMMNSRRRREEVGKSAKPTHRTRGRYCRRHRKRIELFFPFSLVHCFSTFSTPDKEKSRRDAGRPSALFLLLCLSRTSSSLSKWRRCPYSSSLCALFLLLSLLKGIALRSFLVFPSPFLSLFYPDVMSVHAELSMHVW